MKIKAGQYGRFRVTNKFIRISKVLGNKVFYDDRSFCYENDLKVANTPQELIQDMDLIRYKILIGTSRVVSRSIPLAVSGNMKTEVMIYAGSMLIPHSDIVEILTPRGNDYICQWEVKL